jgi:UDP-2,4-diacetamido-2,4,6-trideoxy-beta-L-altropyranose hydrolase
MPPPGTLLIRADSNASIGTGHVMRCLALAQAWMERGGKSTFAVQQLPESLARRLGTEGVSFESLPAKPGAEAEKLAEIAIRERASWVVVDLPYTEDAYQRCLLDAGLHMLLVDDGLRAGTYCADIILNQNLGADTSRYPQRDARTLLLGPQYILLRREFRTGSRPSRKKQTEGDRILVSLGGSDPGNLSARILDALDRACMDRLEVMVVAGAANSHADELRSRVAKSGWRLRTDVTHMQELMVWADMAIIAAGGTLWELLCMGCPVLSYSRNSVQAQVVAELAANGVIRDMGGVEEFDGEALVQVVAELASAPEERARMSEAGQQLVDGGGAERVCNALLTKQVRA